MGDGNVNFFDVDFFAAPVLHESYFGYAAGLQLFNQGFASRVAVLRWDRFENTEYPADPEVIHPQWTGVGDTLLAASYQDPDSPRYTSRWLWVYHPFDFGDIRLRSGVRFTEPGMASYVASVFDIHIVDGVAKQMKESIKREDVMTWPAFPDLPIFELPFLPRPTSGGGSASNTAELELIWPAAFSNTLTVESPDNPPNMLPTLPLRERYQTLWLPISASRLDLPPVLVRASG